MTQLSLALRPGTRGGRREGAGRKPGSRRSTPHRARPEHKARHPVHVTLRAARGTPYLRAQRPFASLRDAIRAASKGAFRVVHFSVQPDHVHLIVEASDKEALSRGMRGLAIRLARQLNLTLRRKGPLWGDRWHGHALRTPRECRNAIVYVLANYRKHVRDETGPVDPLSSAPWFDGWRDARAAHLEALQNGVDPPVRASRTWIGSKGWRLRGLVSVREAPRAARALP